jgi:hypothetical protein
VNTKEEPSGRADFLPYWGNEVHRHMPLWDPHILSGPESSSAIKGTPKKPNFFCSWLLVGADYLSNE